MAASIETSDLVDGTEAGESAEGRSATRAFLIKDLDGTASARVIQALSVTGLPVRGDAHPGDATLFADTIRAIPNGSTKARVSVTYKPFTPESEPPNDDPAQISVGGTVQAIKTNLDIFGNLMAVSHNSKVQNGEVEVQIPMLVKTFSRKESSDPESKAIQFLGTVNSNTQWGPRRTWLCTKLQGNSSDNGQTFLVEYEFQYNADTWDAVVVYQDPDIDGPPAGLIDGVGIRSFAMYNEANFAALVLE